MPAESGKAGDAGKVAEPDEASPNVLGSVHGKNQKQVFGRGGLHGVPGNLDGDASLEQPVHFEIDGIKAGLDRPLDLEKIRAGGAVEGALVSRHQIGAFFGSRKREMGGVAKFPDSVANAGPVCGMDQDIQVAGLPQGNVSVEQFRQGQAFVGHNFKAEFAKVIDDANQLARKKQGFMQVDLMALLEPG